MIATIIKFVSTTFVGNLPLINMMLTIMPFAGTKVAIPYTCNIDIWQNITLLPLQASIFSFVANTALTIVLSLILTPLASLIKKSKLFKNLLNKKSRTPYTSLEKCTIMVVIKSIPLVGNYLSIFIGGFFLNIWQNMLSNIIGSLICSLLSALFIVNASCRIIVLLVLVLEMLAIACIIILHNVRYSTPHTNRKSIVRNS